MVDLKRGTTGSAVAIAAGAEAHVLDDGTVMRLLAAEDAESVARLAAWLKANARAFAPLVMRAHQEERGLSPEAACAVLGALGWRAPADGETTLNLLASCLDVIAGQVTKSPAKGESYEISDRDDALVGCAVATLTSNRPARHSETAIVCLADAGPGGALVLARAFNAVRSGLKLRIVRRLKPADVLQLDDNVVVSLAHSVSRLAEGLEGSEKDVASRFLAELGSVQRMEPSEIGIAEQLERGDHVFHASWGAGTVVTADDASATIDFGSAGTRTLLRSLATLRRAV